MSVSGGSERMQVDVLGGRVRGGRNVFVCSVLLCQLNGMKDSVVCEERDDEDREIGEERPSRKYFRDWVLQTRLWKRRWVDRGEWTVDGQDRWIDRGVPEVVKWHLFPTLFLVCSLAFCRSQ